VLPPYVVILFMFRQLFCRLTCYVYIVLKFYINYNYFIYF
jgi:hypothetical protein